MLSTFIFLADDDHAVKPENSLLFYEALRRHHVPAELVVFQQGGHGFGLSVGTDIPGHWPEIAARWLKWVNHYNPNKNEH
ncbi:MAG: prolyl oligopeptidase family serine peptidase [Bacteroidales bacterium]|nr:prolyl oligopeptidase family serine peptidase [Bacteroidales bacterium]